MPLSSLGRFIDDNGHLPGIPAAENVKRDGVDAGEMSILLLQKTEELTLHLIQLDERLRKLEDKKKTKK